MVTLLGEEGPVRLRPAAEIDLPFILATEEGGRRAGFLGGWPESEHRSALATVGTAYAVAEALPAWRSVGFVILRGLTSPDRNIELKRIALTETDKGYGRHVLRLIARLAFGTLGAHRLWLDVYEHNARARHVYTTQGFVVEGTLRECIRLPGRWASLVVMSILEHEYHPPRP
jgi:RimJ/RimL family protein N-acetyltransferase